MKREKEKRGRVERRVREARQNLAKKAKTKNEREQAEGPKGHVLGASVWQEATGNFNKPQGGKL